MLTGIDPPLVAQELMGMTLVVNTPVVFRFAWSLIQVFLDDHVRTKVQFFGRGDSEMKRLHEYIAPEYLPEHLGGLRTDRVTSGKDGVPHSC